MNKSKAPAVIRWIARIAGLLTGSIIIIIFFGYLIQDIINMVKGNPVEADGFFSMGIAAFFISILPGFILFGLAITGYIFFWFSEKRGVLLTLTGGLSAWLFITVTCYLRSNYVVLGNGSIVLFSLKLLVTLILIIILPALLILLSRLLESKGGKAEESGETSISDI